MRFDVVIQPDLGHSNVIGIIYLFTGKMVIDPEFGIEHEETFHEAFEWPKEFEHQAEVLKACSNELIYVWLKTRS